ncbi:hypothetical protein Pfl01_0159 [Pseudomonas fluorescens Pf0-1]|uniref:Uncharacterized protein n=1 Tax=Pseudomonas fluorescens (strain Pf0-1) TaxID=205922 RepID=Q3KK03_PSEPF|nr:hypothetical protein Pfl01_0159 [Pseudomonas fluorescens Pf0-1]
MRRVVATAVAADTSAAGLAAQRTGARPGRTAMTTALTAKTTATTTGTAVERTGDTAATAATGRRVAGDRDVVQGEDAGVENPPAHGAGCAVAAITAIARDQAPGNDQTIQGHRAAGGDFHHSGPVLAIERDVGNPVVVQVTIDSNVLVDQQFRG